MGIRYAMPPVLMHDVIDDLDAVHRLLRARAPYAPLGGWYSPGADPDARTRPLWFRDDWVHDDVHVEGADLFLRHEGYIEAAKAFYDVEVVEPQSVYTNLMVGIEGGGPAHTDNPRFHGRDRTNTPMWLLRAMLWSGLFDAYEIVQATAIWWMDDVPEGGAIRYWADGPDQPPHEHVGAMANTALFGDNHGMFHQVGPIGPFDGGPRRVSPRATLGPVDGEPSPVAGAGAGEEWAVVDHGEEVLRVPLDRIRVSVLWKADVYPTAAERDARMADRLSMDDVAAAFDADLGDRGLDLRLDLDRLDDPAHTAELAAVYPEATPVDALPSVLG